MGKQARLSRLRAADTDREQVAQRLLSAHAEGRLDLSEYDERVQQVWAARTYDQLEQLTADLPGPRAAVAERSRRINGFAIASLVLGLVWMFWIGSALALAFGYIARQQIKRRGERGAELATVGIVLGWVGVGTLTILLIVTMLAVLLAGQLF